MTCTAPPNWWGGYGFAASIARRYECKVGGGGGGGGEVAKATVAEPSPSCPLLFL